MREDIITGLRNGLERGESLESSMKSFINAGYHPIDVKQAAQALTNKSYQSTTPKIVNPTFPSISPQLPSLPKLPVPPSKKLPDVQSPQYQQTNSMPESSQLKEKSTKGPSFKLISILIVVLLLLVSLLVVAIIYGQQIIDAIFGS